MAGALHELLDTLQGRAAVGGPTQGQDILVLGGGKMDQTVRSDVDGDGWSEAHSWNTRNLYLAIDRQGDGQITGRDDLLTLGQGGANSLGWLDANGDGILDARDPGFAALKVWLDANGDAIAQDNELTGITATLAATEDAAQLIDPATPPANDSDVKNAHACRIYCLRHIAWGSRRRYSAGIHSKTRHDTGLRPPRPGVRQYPREKQVVCYWESPRRPIGTTVTEQVSI